MKISLYKKKLIYYLWGISILGISMGKLSLKSKHVFFSELV